MLTATRTAHYIVEPSPQPSKNLLNVTVRRIDTLAQDICSFELVSGDGSSLPSFTAGAHIDVYLPRGNIRQYSLCSDPSDTSRYVIAVLRDKNGRGGSIIMHDELHVGSTIQVSRPRNHFPLTRGASRHQLVAGGIGVTPMISMLTDLHSRGEDFHLHYCTRSRAYTAFQEVLRPLIAAGRVTIYHDDEQGCGLDFRATFQEFVPNEHLYYCGPNGFMDAVKQATAHWPAGHVHFERFSAAPKTSDDMQTEAQVEFTVELARSGGSYSVKAGETIVDVIKRQGIDVDVSCEEGYCGTCMTRYLDGQPEHHDTVLDDDDRSRFVMICCARARDGKLVLDL